MEWASKEDEISMSIETEFAEYLNQSGFQRFIDAWILKYKRLGHLGGKVVLDHLTQREQQCIGGLLGLDLSSGRLELSFHQFQKKLRDTRFAEVNILESLQIIKQSYIYTQKEINSLYQQQLSVFKNTILSQFEDTKAYKWLKYYLENDRFVKKYYDYSPEKYNTVLIHVCHALNQLPICQNQYQLLAVFSQQITKNPHYFDEDLPRDLLLKGICEILNIHTSLENAQEISDILYNAGILKDDLSNYCYICHIRPQKQYEAWDGFFHLYEPWNVNLYNINSVKGLFQKMPILILENPSVFRVLCSFVSNQNIDIGLVSSNGQINVCTYLLLDRLIESGCQLYYTGDYDPEGLLIAQKLKQRYKENLILWSYNQQWFEEIKVEQIEISEKRLQMLKQIQSKELQSITHSICNDRAFGYQEGLIDLYKDEIIKCFKM